MTDEDITYLLTHSAPRGVAADPRIQPGLQTIITESRALARKKRHPARLLWFAVPVILAPTVALGLTAGIEERMVPDFTIPVTYTTDTGRNVSCSVNFYNEEVHDQETTTGLSDWLRTQNWTGIGQRMYELALTHVASADPETTAPDSWKSSAKEWIEWVAWKDAEGDLIDDTMPSSVFGPYGSYGGNTDCTGELH